MSRGGDVGYNEVRDATRRLGELAAHLHEDVIGELQEQRVRRSGLEEYRERVDQVAETAEDYASCVEQDDVPESLPDYEQQDVRAELVRGQRFFSYIQTVQVVFDEASSARELDDALEELGHPAKTHVTQEYDEDTFREAYEDEWPDKTLDEADEERLREWAQWTEGTAEDYNHEAVSSPSYKT